MTASLVWLDGEILPIEHARISPTDRGFLLGDGLFETLRITRGTAPHAQRHLARLATGCETLGFLSPPLDVLQSAMDDLLAESAVQDGVLRLTVTRGRGARGVLPSGPIRPTVLLQCGDGIPTIAAPARLNIARFRRDGACPLSRVKSLGFLPSIMSRIEARDAGWDDALLLGQTGAIAEASAANLLVLTRDGSILTPPLRDGALPGTSRARLLDAAFCEEHSIYPQNLGRFIGAWLVNALSLTPVVEIDGHTLPPALHIQNTLAAFLFPN